MFGKIFKKEILPDFWVNYSQLFKKSQEGDLDKVRFVVFDTETTGLNIDSDRVLSIGAIAIKSNNLNVSDSYEAYINQEIFNAETVEVHGLLQGGKIFKKSEEEVLEEFVNYIGDSVLVAHHTAFDVAMINAGLKRMGLSYLKNKTLDTGILFKKTSECANTNKHYSLDYLCGLFKVKLHDRHTASGDAFITGVLFLKILASLKKVRNISLSDLFFNTQRRGLL